MAKYLIQDIIPPERNGRPRVAGTPRVQKSSEVETRTEGHRQATIRVTKHAPRLEQEEVEAPEEHVREHPTSIVREHIERPPKEHDRKFFEEETLKPPTRPRGNMVHHLHGPVTRETGSGAWGSWLPWVLGTLGVVVLVVVVMTIMGGAEVTVVPKKDSLVMDQRMSAFKTPTSTELPFSVMKVSLEESREVPAVGEKAVTAKASGRIVVYNKQNVTQRLIKNTRFQSPSGKIYRISDSINVPKQTTSGGKTTPGSIEVTVYADEAGPEYNSDPTDFTLPGLKGSPTFDKVYARSKGPLTGGASGTIKSVTEDDMKIARDELRVALETKLRTKARSDLAPSQISFDTGIVVELQNAELSKAAASSPDKAVVTQKGTVYLIAFDKEALTRAIVGLLIQTYKGESVTILNLESLTLEMGKTTGSELWEKDRIDFTLRGTPALEWSIDTAMIKSTLAGTPRERFGSLMAQFPTVEHAEAEVSPPWKRSFPSEAEDIEVVVETPRTPSE